MVIVYLALASSSRLYASNLKAIESLDNGGRITIVAYGTSLTEKGLWVETLQALLDERYPGRATVINSGGSGKHSQWGVDNLDKRVIAHGPDLVLLEFSVNDSVARFQCSPEQARNNLIRMIERIREARPECEFVLMTTSPADKFPEGHQSHRRQIETYHQIYRDVAEEQGFELIDLYSIWKDLKAKDPARYAVSLPDTIHPSRIGQKEIVTPAILAGLGLN